MVECIVTVTLASKLPPKTCLIVPEMVVIGRPSGNLVFNADLDFDASFRSSYVVPKWKVNRINKGGLVPLCSR
jgi:hypothetical protein